MNRKSGYDGGYRPSFEGKTHRSNNANAVEKSKSTITNVEEDAKQPETNMQSAPLSDRESVIRDKRMPDPPPNYRGMIYDVSLNDGIEAEGLDRLVKNDISYSDYEKKRREDEYKKNKTVSAMGRNALHEDNDVSCDANGLESLVEGLKSKKFSSEDILLCAMILLMLNSGSDDDILMVLVLMMLL